MHRALASFVFVFLAAIVLAVVPSKAQEGDLQAILNRVNELMRTGNSAAALIEAKKFEADVKAQFGTDHANYAIALSNMAAVYRYQNENVEAQELFQRALAIYEKTLGREHPNVTLTLGGLARIPVARQVR